MPLRIAIFLSVATTVWTLATYYMDRRLVTPLETKRAKRITRGLLWSASALVPLNFFLFRAGATFAALKISAYVLMAAFVLLFFLLLARDLGFGISAKLGWIPGRSRTPESSAHAPEFEPEEVKEADAPADAGRRRFLERATNAAALGATGVTLASGYREATRIPDVVEVEIPIAGLPPALQNYRVAQISDVHVGMPTIHGAWLEGVVAKVNELEADLVAITGDLIDGYVEQLGDRVAPIGDLRGRDGVYFCTGNHEYYWDGPAWVERVRELGVTPLVNEHRLIERGGAKLLIAGATDIRSGGSVPGHLTDPAGAKKDASGAVPAHDLSILLAHQPTSLPAAKAAGYDLQLSGHTHGGQFFPISLFTKLLFHPYDQGLGRDGDTWIYVNRGTGYWGPINRAGVPAEITLLRLVPA